MFKKAAILVMSVAVITGNSSVIALAAESSDGVYYLDQDWSGDVVVVSDDGSTSLETESDTETETTLETESFGYNLDNDDFFSSETPNTEVATSPATVTSLNVNTRTKVRETEAQTEEVNKETETELETSAQTAELPKTGDFSIIDRINDFVQECIYAIVG